MNKRPKSFYSNSPSDNTPYSTKRQENSSRSLSKRYEKLYENPKNVKDAFNFYNNRHDKVEVDDSSPKPMENDLDVEQPRIDSPERKISRECNLSPVKLNSFDKTEDRFIIKVVHGGFCRIFTYRRSCGFDYFRSQLYTQGKQPYKGPCSWFDYQNDRISLIDENDLNSMLDFFELAGERYIKVFLNNPSNNQL
uniref:BTB_2 domain-containing protein n=1 Tax=Strongyloides venezuelensis TaxID=75913 RepID=A0A0K0FNM4_STRVS